MRTYDATVPQLKKMLESLDLWIEKAIAHASARAFDPDVLLSARLAPDQYPLLNQIQAACDSAKFAAARLAGKQAPSHPDTEKTIGEIRQRIRKVITYLETFATDDFANADARLIELPFLEGKVVLGEHYLVEMALPNFYFHVVMAYAILRHNGVALGKKDFIASLSIRER